MLIQNKKYCGGNSEVFHYEARWEDDLCFKTIESLLSLTKDSIRQNTFSWCNINQICKEYQYTRLCKTSFWNVKSSIQNKGISTFPPWDIFGLESISTFWTISSLCVLSCLKYFLMYILGEIVTKLDKKNYINFSFFQIHYSVRIGYISFFSSSNMQKFHHPLGCHATGINSSLIFF